MFVVYFFNSSLEYQFIGWLKTRKWDETDASMVPASTKDEVNDTLRKALI